MELLLFELLSDFNTRKQQCEVLVILWKDFVTPAFLEMLPDMLRGYPNL
jgi:hypothetical protein